MANGNNLKATPALIVGLGGTGVRALTHLKKDLITLNQGILPDEVRLLAFDTVREPDVIVGGLEAEDNEAASGVRLEASEGEYVHIGGNIKPFMREAASNNGNVSKMPQVSSWLQAECYLKTLQDAQFLLEHGAGMLPQFGRAGLFDDVRAPGMSKIYTSLNRAIKHVKDKTNANTIEVALLTSTAGGTGAGMFIDIAHLVRQIAGDTNIRLRGFIVLPEAFAKIPSGVTSDMKARSYAALRETKRFMISFDFRRGYPMYYHSDRGDHDAKNIWQGRIQSKLFDYMYLIDGRRDKNDLTQYLPDFGVAPSIADMVSSVLDVRGGQKFTEHENNMHDMMNAQDVNVERTANYGTIGTYTIVLPIYHIVDGFAHQLSLEALEAWLRPAEKSDGIPTSLMFDQNRDAGIGQRGSEGALTFLRMTEVVDHHNAENRVRGTHLLQEVSRVTGIYSPDNPRIVNELAGRPLQPWLDIFTPPGDNPEILEIVRQVNAVTRNALTNVVPTSKDVQGERPPDALRRIEDNVRTFKARHLGGERTDGRREGGDYRQALNRLAVIHEARFHLMLNTHATNILNGRPSEDALKAKGGRLGYFIDFLDGLSKELTTFQDVMTQVREMREKRGTRRSVLAQANGSQNEMRDKADSRFPGRAVGAQKNYIEAEQRLIDTFRLEILEETVQVTVRALLDYIRSAKKDAANWVAALGVGNKSLYARLLQGQEQLRANREADAAIKVREVIKDEKYEQRLFQQGARDGQAVVDILNDLEWKTQIAEDGVTPVFKLGVTCANSGADGSAELETQTAMDNRQIFLARAGQPFSDIRETETCLKYLMNKYRGNDLGEKLVSNSGLMLSYDRGQGSIPANYLRVAHGEGGNDLNFLSEVLKTVTNTTNATGDFVASVQSADPYKMTLVYTLDVIPLDNITSYKRGNGDYKAFSSQCGREILHRFPAEVAAVGYEDRLGELNENRRFFNDQVVIQLEYLDRFRLFTNCLAFRLIESDSQQDQGGTTQNYWALKLPKDKVSDFKELGPVEIQLSDPVSGEPDLLKAIGQFNYEGHDVRADRRDPNDTLRTIDYDRVRRALLKAQQERGEIAGAKLDDLMDIYKKALKNMEESDAAEFRTLLGRKKWVLQQQKGQLKEWRDMDNLVMKDLATVMTLILKDAVSSLEYDIQTKARYATS